MILRGMEMRSAGVDSMVPSTSGSLSRCKVWLHSGMNGICRMASSIGRDGKVGPDVQGSYEEIFLRKLRMTVA